MWSVQQCGYGKHEGTHCFFTWLILFFNFCSLCTHFDRFCLPYMQSACFETGSLKSWNVINTPEKHEKETHPLPMSSNFSILFRLMFPNFLPASCNYRYVENLVLSLKCGGIFNIYSVVKSDWEAILTKSYCNCILRL